MSPTARVSLSLFLSLSLFFFLGSVCARSVPNHELSKSTGWNQTCVEGSCPPRNIHLAVTGHPSGLAVSWLTLGLSKTSTVKYGFHPRSYHSLAAGVSHTYQGSDENDYVFFNHDVVLTDLIPNKRYFFVCGDEEGGFSEELSFTTPALKPEHDATIAMYGDMGISNSQTTIKALTALAKKGLYDLVFHVGDISYADDYPSGMYEEVWNAWFEQLSEVMKRVPYMVTPGNHEFSCGHAGCDYTANFTAYLHRFRMPYQESNALNNMWYSFDYSNIHFIAISTETDFSDAPEGTHLFGDQMKWLREDLTKANNNRKNVPWIIVGGHRPIYSSSKGYTSSGVPFGDTLHLQTAVEDLFQEFHVDLFVVGHVHSYERCYPTYKSMKVSDSYVNPNATVYVIAGAAGNTEGFANPTPDSWDQPPPVWSAHRFGTDYGFALVRVFRKADSKQDVLNWRFFRSGDGGLEDEFNLIKDIPSH